MEKEKMKNVFVMILAGVALAVVGVGCTSFETNRGGREVEVKMPLNVEPIVEAGNQMVEGNATVNCLFGIFTWGVSSQAVGVDYFNHCSSASVFTSAADVAKNGAAYNACTGANADLLLAARYNVTETNYFVFKKVECQVKGYPGTLKGISIKK